MSKLNEIIADAVGGALAETLGNVAKVGASAGANKAARAECVDVTPCAIGDMPAGERYTLKDRDAVSIKNGAGILHLSDGSQEYAVPVVEGRAGWKFSGVVIYPNADAMEREGKGLIAAAAAVRKANAKTRAKREANAPAAQDAQVAAISAAVAQAVAAALAAAK